MLNREHPLFERALNWVRLFPGGLTAQDKIDLRNIICKTFGITQEQLLESLNGELQIDRGTQLDPKADEAELLHILPPGGFYAKYAEYTSRSEAPLAYHLFCAAGGVGAVVNRRVWFDMGYYRLFPNLGIILLGPSGIKKTSATNIIVSMLAQIELVKIYSEKLTPEQLVEAMKDHAQGLLYAPEMAVFLGRQRYMEGIVPLVTRFMDCPDVWSNETIGRGKTTLNNIGISSLMCSTIEWFVNNTPADVIKGGFIPRHVLVVQETSHREEAIPRPGDPKERERIMYELSQAFQLQGQLFLAANTEQCYRQWYHDHKRSAKGAEHELLVSYYQRKPDHTLRLAICIHLAEHGTLTLCLDCFTRAVEILDWIEKFYPGLIRQMFKTGSGHSAELVLNTIRSSGGVIDHSDLLRRLQHRFNGQELRPIIGGLKDAGMIAEHHDKLQHVYVLQRRQE